MGRPSTPPALLISATASLAPSRMLTPIDDEPPVNGPDRPTLIGSAARLDVINAALPASADRIIFNVTDSPPTVAQIGVFFPKRYIAYRASTKDGCARQGSASAASGDGRIGLMC